MKTALSFLTALALLSASSVFAGDWLGFRGSAGDGVTGEQAPTTWSANDNVAWKIPLPQPSNGSPIVAAGRVFVTSTEDPEGRQRSLYCFDAKTGEQQWVQTVAFDKEMPHHKTNPHGSSTPASDGRHVVVWHASAGLYCYDVEGNELWSRNLGEYRHMWGYGTSPVILGDRVILHTGPGKTCVVIAVKLDSGETIWRHDEPLEGTGDHRDDGNPQGSWSTPVVTQVGKQQQAIVMLPKRVVSFNAESGEIIWTCDGLRHDRGDLAYSSPIIAGDLCFVTGGYRGPGMAIRLNGSGNVTDSHRLWRNEKNPQSIGSGVYVDGYVYRPNGEGGKGLQCIDPNTGDVQWSQCTPDASWGSLVQSGELLYVTNQDGTTVVFRPNPEEYDEVSQNELDETCNGTPAVAERHVYIRTHEHLYCIAD